jgi:hypothetical protein
MRQAQLITGNVGFEIELRYSSLQFGICRYLGHHEKKKKKKKEKPNWKANKNGGGECVHI